MQSLNLRNRRLRHEILRRRVVRGLNVRIKTVFLQMLCQKELVREMKMSKQEYADYIKQKMPPSPLWRDMLLAFLIGGLICCVGQALLSLYLALGAAEDDAGAWTCASMIFLGALFTGLGLYGRLAKYAGAGTLVPITGFANAVVSPALEFKTDACDIIRPSQKGP